MPIKKFFSTVTPTLTIDLGDLEFPKQLMYIGEEHNIKRYVYAIRYQGDSIIKYGMSERYENIRATGRVSNCYFHTLYEQLGFLPGWTTPLQSSKRLTQIIMEMKEFNLPISHNLFSIDIWAVPADITRKEMSYLEGELCYAHFKQNGEPPIGNRDKEHKYYMKWAGIKYDEFT